ncbi:MAG: hypothetical protein U1F36_13325 [Planctomycetota bacterium]
MRSGSTTAASLAVAVLWCAAACGEKTSAPKPAPAQLLGIEFGSGLRIPREEIDAFDPYFDALDARVGHKQRHRVLLERHLLPLALVRDGFRPRYDEAMQRAQELCRVAGNSREFERIASLAGGERIEHRQRTQLPLPVSRFARDESVIGAVSPPLPTAEGIWVVTVLEIAHGLTLSDDYLTLFAVKFPVPDTPSLSDWLDHRHAEVRGMPVHCDDDLRDALPDWLRS